MSGSKQLKMYNLNVNVATALPGNFLGLDTQGATPRTPEILNTLMTMTNPFDALAKSGRDNSPGSEESCSGTGSPLGSPTNSPPSVQHTCSQLIKEGLKLTIQTKRKQSGSDTREDLEEFNMKRTKKDELTAEDEERRKRRRERNKIAATKCRMKKREKTANLVQESEQLETQNVDLKSQIQDLEKQRRRLMDMLAMHSATCVKNNPATNVANSQQFEQYVSTNETFINNYESQPNFSETASPDFEIGSTNGTALSSISKDPNFAKLLDAPGTQSIPRSFDRTYSPNLYNTAVTTNYYQAKNKISYDFRSEDERFKKSAKVFGKSKDESYRASKRLVNELDSEDHIFRTNFHDDSDCYRPNGMIDGNYFTNRTDIFSNNDYNSNFNNNALDNGCMA